MSDVKCPYCSHWQEINHDDGYGYDEGETHEQDCVSCNKTFNFETTISYSYEVSCLNGEHDMDVEEMEIRGRKFLVKECRRCDFYDTEAVNE